MDIEQLATSAVIANISETDCLSAFINSGDKEPSWDGFIYVYKSKIKKKENLEGRVSVQVKGIANNNLSAKITFPVEVTDLNNYLHDGGVIFFVVRIHKKDSNKKKIYYETLTPVKLHNYLKEAKGQKRKTINLEEFPSDKNDKTSIVINFLNHSRKQVSYVKSGFISVDEIQKNRSKHKLTVSVAGYGNNTPDSVFSALLKSETYTYVTNVETNAEIPVDSPVTIQAIIKKIDKQISIDEICYYDNYEWSRSAEGTTIKIGESITLSFGNFETPTVKTEICFSKYLRKAAKDMQFIIDALTAKRFNLDTIELRLDSFVDNNTDFISTTQNQLAFYLKIIEMLNILNVSEDLNTDELTTEEKRNIEILIKAFVDKKEITNIDKTPTSVLDIKLSNITLKLIVKKKRNGSHLIEDFFNSEINVLYKVENEDYQATSPYSALSKDDYLVISNINYNKILESYKKVAIQNPNVFERANADLLQMLLAFDEKPKLELLNAAKDLAGWLFTNKKNKRKNILWLNYLQVIKRGRPFIDKEEKQLCEIAEDSNASEQEKIGAYLLLGNQIAAEIHFEKLEPKEQTFFKSLPIYKFWKHTKTLST